jgi:hypothetical protein
MTMDLEGDLRREFDAATPPSSLTFHPESIVRQGNRTIRRHRIVAGGSAAMALALVATGVGLLDRPHDSAPPQPATHTATTGIVRTDMGYTPYGTFQIELNRDAKVTSNVKLFLVKKGGERREVGAWSTIKPGQKPDATWKSGMVDGHPFTVGLVPGADADVRLANGASHVILLDPVKDTGYSAFAVQYKNGDQKEPARPAEIASISWSGPTGIVDGIEGDHRLTGQVLAMDQSVAVKVVLRPGTGGRTEVLGDIRLKTTTGFASLPLTVTTSDASGAAVVTGRKPIERLITKGTEMGRREVVDGAPMAAGILPAGATDIGVILTTGEIASGLPVSERLPDGRVIFAIKAESAQPSQPSKDSIKAVTWTNADGSLGRKDVTQKQP